MLFNYIKTIIYIIKVDILCIKLILPNLIQLDKTLYKIFKFNLNLSEKVSIIVIFNISIQFEIFLLLFFFI